jgi:predicted NAD/FAD-binding protein
MKIAIIGTGIAGNVVANRLALRHDITVYEADNRIGGHTHTVDVLAGGRRWAVDTGFIVYNDVTYPTFIALLDELGVESQPSDMSFSVSDRRSGLEYNGASLNALFAQRSNLLRPSFHRMLRDILLQREAPALLNQAMPTRWAVLTDQ